MSVKRKFIRNIARDTIRSRQKEIREVTRYRSFRSVVELVKMKKVQQRTQ